MAKSKGFSVGVDTNTLIFTGALILGAYYVVNRFGQATGLVDSKGDRDRQAELSKDYWNPNFYNDVYQKYKKPYAIPSDAKAEAFCKRLYDADAWGFWNNDSDVLAVISEMRSKVYLSYLCDYWQNKSPYIKTQMCYHNSCKMISLVSYLQKFLKDESWTSIKQIMSNKPLYV